MLKYSFITSRNQLNVRAVTFMLSGQAMQLLYTSIDQTLVNSFHGLLNCEIVALDGHVITT